VCDVRWANVIRTGTNWVIIDAAETATQIGDRMPAHLQVPTGNFARIALSDIHIRTYHYCAGMGYVYVDNVVILILILYVVVTTGWTGGRIASEQYDLLMVADMLRDVNSVPHNFQTLLNATPNGPPVWNALNNSASVMPVLGLPYFVGQPP
jgi:hypothetical protein